MKLKYHSVVQKQGCRTLRKDERVIAKEVREASEMSHQNIRNGPLPGGELQVERKRTNIEAWTRQHQKMGVEIIRNGSSKHQKWALVWRGTPGTDETHQYRSMCKGNIRKWVRETSGNG